LGVEAPDDVRIFREEIYEPEGAVKNGKPAGIGDPH
jgi:sRNA-binding carbon storage regulator CsrA